MHGKGRKEKKKKRLNEEKGDILSLLQKGESPLFYSSLEKRGKGRIAQTPRGGGGRPTSMYKGGDCVFQGKGI